MCGGCVLLPHTLLLLCNTYKIPWTNALNKGAMHCQISPIKFELANNAFGVGMAEMDLVFTQFTHYS